MKNNKIKFITPCTRSYIKKLSNYLDIEFQGDINKVKKSDKLLLLWHPFGYVRTKKWYNKSYWKYELYSWYRKHNKPVYTVERGGLPNCIYIDKNGYLFNSSSYHKENWDKPLNKIQLKNISTYIKNMKTTKSTLENQKSKRISKNDFFKFIKVKKPLTIFVPFQTRCDSVTVMWSDWVKNLLGFQKVISQIAKENPNILFLVKDHPHESVQRMPITSPNIKSVNYLHYKDCIDYSDIIITINSSIGLQSMFWKKPVIIVGSAYFQHEGLNCKANNKEEIIRLIKNPILPDYEKIQRFLYFLKYQFYTECTMVKHSPRKISRIVFEHPYKNEKIIRRINEQK